MIMATKSEFDKLIKQKFLNGDPILPGVFAKSEGLYGRTITTRGRTKDYDTYFSESFGREILDKIDNKIRDCFIEKGKGGELKNKFFSVASSSRFAVANFSEKNISGIISFINQYAGEKIQNISFEKDLHIKNVSGTSPQMDVWIQTSHDIFFEVKCHEIFDEYEHANIKLSTQYRNNAIFKEIIKHYAIDLSTRERSYVKDGKTHNYYILNRNMFDIMTKTSRFDLKQFLCHLMGIISNKEITSEVEFNYLFYKNDNNQFKKVYAELENELSVIRNSFEWIFTKYKIKFSWFYNEKFSTLEQNSTFS